MTENALSAENLMKEVKVDERKWSGVPSDAEIDETVKEIEKRGIKVIVVEDREKALEKLKELIPAGAEIMNGTSTTLIEVGFVDFLKGGKHKWKNLHEAILAEKDQEKQGELRRKSVTAEYFLSGVNAIAKTGELVSNDASGSRVGAWPFAAKNLVLVSGVNKIVPSLDDAIKRIREYALPIENERAKKVYGMGSRLGKMVILFNEYPGRATLVLVKERLGF